MTFNLLQNSYPHLYNLRESLRIHSNASQEDFSNEIRRLLDLKKNDPSFIQELSNFSRQLLQEANFISAFTDYGIQSNREFTQEILRRIKHKILPALLPKNALIHSIKIMVEGPKDLLWLDKMQNQHWEILFSIINPSYINQTKLLLSRQIQHALLILSHRITNISIDPYLVNKMPEFDDQNSPFFELNYQITLISRKHDAIHCIEKDEKNKILHLLSVCKKLYEQIEEQKDEKGTSLHLTFITIGAQQNIDRMQLLVNLLLPATDTKKAHFAARLLRDLVKAVHTQYSLTEFIQKNSRTLAYRIANHTSEKGEHYVGFSRGENAALFRSALGGGLMVVLLVYLKYFIHGFHVSLFFEGILFGLTYGLGFIAMHFFHFTLATKQPAMTASFIAQSIGKEADASKKVFKQILRSQYISLIGNLVVVLPLCFITALLYKHLLNAPVFDQRGAIHQLYSNHPFYSLSIFYALITGVYLSVSSWVIGYVDNKVVFSEIQQRILQHPYLIKQFSLEKRTRISQFVEKNLGAIIGNLFLGLCLGMAGNLGVFLGLPYDIRHITISAGNFGIALGSNLHMPLDLILMTLFGILLIGLTNIFVSFFISFIVACQSRSLSWKESIRLLF